MNKTQKLQKVTEAIHKACPDLLKLKFGTSVYCEQALEDDRGDYHDFFGDYIRQINNEECEVLIECESDDLERGQTEMIIPYSIESLEILGQPINLPEVLRAVQDKMGSYDFEIIETFRTTFLEKLLKDWNFLKTLDQQEEPVIDLLFNILCT